MRDFCLGTRLYEMISLLFEPFYWDKNHWLEQNQPIKAGQFTHK